MDDPANENGRDGTGIKWHLKLPVDQTDAVLGSPVVFELADANGSMLASVSMPAETINGLLGPHLSLFAELQLDGSVSLDSEFFALFPSSKMTDIYELVKEGIAPEMLEDELDVKNRLAILRERLTDALALVDQTLSNLDKQQP
jgi:hypothetical protein